jgi:hypothetical protein
VENIEKTINFYFFMDVINLEGNCKSLPMLGKWPLQSALANHFLSFHPQTVTTAH